MRTDHFFTIGAPHVKEAIPCQDYAISGNHGDLHYAIISDGCSCGAQPGQKFDPANTDIGSRLVAHALINELVSAPDKTISNEFMKRVILRLGEMHYTANPNDLLSTLVAVISNGNTFSVVMAGDGTYALKYLDGSMHVVSVSWNKNTPYYLAYSAIGKYDEFAHVHQCQADGSFLLNPDVVTVSEWFIFPSGLVEECSHHDCLAIHAPYGFMRSYYSTAKVESISVFSDGLDRFERVLGDGVRALYPIPEIIQKLTAFKNSTGRFVARRVASFLKRDTPALPEDDFSMATIWFGD